MGSLVWLASVGMAVAAEWTYQVRPGDSLWEIGQRVLDDPNHWPRVQQHNRIERPDRLIPGSRLRIPVAWLRIRPAPARVIATQGPVRLVDVGQSPGRTAVEGDILVSGSRIETSTEATATIAFADGSRMLVQGGTVLQFDVLSAFGETGMVDTRVRLQRGRVESRVRPNQGPAGNFVIETQPATTTVRGTEFRVATGGSPARTITEVVSGEVEVSDQRASRRLRPLQATVFALGSESPPVVDLLPAPVLPPSTASTRKPGDPITWQQVPGASRYRVRYELAEFGRVAAEQVVDQASTALPLLDNGNYRLQVRAIDRHDIEGQDAEVALTVLGTPEPPFAVMPQANAVLPPGGVAFRWTVPDTALSYRLQVARDRDFRDLVTDQRDLRRPGHSLREALPPGTYHWRVSSTDSAGRTGPYGDGETFQIRERSAAPDADSIARERATIRWRGGIPGQRYHVQVARDPAYQEIVVDEIVSEPAIGIERIGKGRGYLRVRLIDADGFEGQFSESQQIRLGCTWCRIGAGLGMLGLLLL